MRSAIARASTDTGVANPYRRGDADDAANGRHRGERLSHSIAQR
jgi:hypothetical protein